MTRISSPEGVIAYEYDILGRKTWTSTLDPARLAAGDSVAAATLDATSYTYDALGRLFAVTVTRRNGTNLTTPEVTRHTYDPLGNLIRQDLPNGVITSYVYDSLNRLDTLTHYRSTGANPELDTNLSDNLKVAEFDYDVRADGQRTGMVEQFWVDADNTADVVNSYSWTYDGLDRLVDEVFATNLDDIVDGVTSVGLEAESSLPDTSRPMRDYHDHYVFDLTGNRLQKSTDLDDDNDVDSVVESTYDANDRLLTEQLWGTSSRLTTYAYDHTQQTSKVTYQGATELAANRLRSLQFQYDLQGRLGIATSIVYDGTTGTTTHLECTTYDYNASGIRVSALTETDTNGDGTFDSSVQTQWLNDPQNFTGYSQVIRETHSDPVTGYALKVVSYTFGLDEISQTTVTYESGQPGTSTVLFFAHDGHGSVRALLNAVQAIAVASGARQLFAFDAYGNALGFQELAAVTRLLYSGEQFDQNAMAQYLRARYYNGAAGRSISLDPFSGDRADPKSFHKYIYAYSQPVNNTDPSGNNPFFPNDRLGTHVSKYLGDVFKLVGTLSGNPNRWANQWTSTIRNNYYSMPPVPGAAPSGGKPDLVNIEGGTNNSDHYEIKRGAFIGLILPFLMAKDAAKAEGQLQRDGATLRSYLPTVNWSRGTDYINYVFPHPGFWSPWMPKDSILVTFNDYDQYPGVVLYDFVDKEELKVPEIDFSPLILFAAASAYRETWRAQGIIAAQRIYVSQQLATTTTMAANGKAADNARFTLVASIGAGAIGVGLSMGLA